MNKDRPFRRIAIQRSTAEEEVTGQAAGRVKCPKTKKWIADVHCYPLFCGFCVSRGGIEVHCEFGIESRA